MAEHVEVVIKIPKSYLTHPQDYTCLAECVRRGVLLPKGHGRLIDENELIDEIVCEEIDGRYYDVIYAHSIYDAPTIIEAS